MVGHGGGGAGGGERYGGHWGVGGRGHQGGGVGYWGAKYMQNSTVWVVWYSIMCG